MSVGKENKNTKTGKGKNKTHTERERVFLCRVRLYFALGGEIGIIFFGADVLMSGSRSFDIENEKK